MNNPQGITVPHWNVLELQDPNASAAFGPCAGPSDTTTYNFGGKPCQCKSSRLHTEVLTTPGSDVFTNDVFSYPFPSSRAAFDPSRSLIDPALDRVDNQRGNNAYQNRQQAENSQFNFGQPSSTQESSSGGSPTPSASQPERCGKQCSQKQAVTAMVSDLASRHGRGYGCVQIEFGGQAVCQKCGVSFASTMKRTVQPGR